MCAAHGNYFNQSYAHVIGEQIEPGFKAAGIEVEVRNQCMGGTETFPFSWCMETFVGGDVDLVGFDFGGGPWI